MRLLFDIITTGHHIEYLHHLYMMMAEKQDQKYMVVVPKDFSLRGAQYKWPVVNHIQFDFIPTDICQRVQTSNRLLSAFRKCKLLRYYVRKYQATDIMLIRLIDFIPFLPILIPQRVNVTGIIYKIYLYEWKIYPLWRKIVEIFKYSIISANNCIRNVMILNDMSAAHALNKLYHTRKFKFLIDPYNDIAYKPQNVRFNLKIPSDHKMFIHVGSMNRRKGTLTVLQAMALLPEEVKKKTTLVIAGIVREDIKEEFYELLDPIKAMCHIIVFDEYCSNEFLADLCYSCDYILIPYSVKAQSSGLLAHASKYQKPVIGPCGGLIGKLIRKFKLGIMLPVINAKNLAMAMEKADSIKTSSNYSEVSSISNFQQQLSLFF